MRENNRPPSRSDRTVQIDGRLGFSGEDFVAVVHEHMATGKIKVSPDFGGKTKNLEGFRQIDTCSK